MKRTRLSFLVLVFIFALVLTSCGGNKQPDGADQSYKKVLLEGWQEYALTYSDGASGKLSDAASDFSLALNEKYNLSIPLESDLITENEQIPAKSLEILIGDTNRPESSEAKENLRANDYFIGMINDRIVIAGGSDGATVAALEYFTANLMESDGLYYPKKGYTHKASYVVDSLTIGGVDISEYAIVTEGDMSSFEKNTVAILRDIIADVCGVNLEIKAATDEEQTYEILIGNTGRAITSKETERGTYSTEQTDTKLAFFGNGENVSTFILKGFINTLLSIPEGESYDIRFENVSSQPYIVPSLVENNLPADLPDLRDRYDYDVLSAETTFNRFLATVDELPDEVTVLDPIELENYPLSQGKKQVYVSTSGDDSNAGTKEAPYKTISRALEDMKYQGGGVIWVEGGNYSLEEAIVVDESHSGTIVSPLFIKSYGDEDVTLTSNVTVDSTGFKPVDPLRDISAARIKPEARDNVYYINLYDLGWTEEDIVPITKEAGPARIYVGGEEYTLAQFPNAFYEDGVTRTESIDLLYFKYVYDTGSVTNSDGNLYWPWLERVEKDPILTPESVLGWEIRVLNSRDRLADKGDEAMGDEILSWVNTGDIWYYGSTFEGWEHGYYTIDPECVHGNGLLGTLRKDGFYSLKSVQPNPYGTKVSGNSAAGRNTFFLFNAVEALDAPGEWFIDRENGNLYIYPKNGDITSQSVSYSGSNIFDLITVQGASCVVLDGIGADCASSSAIVVNKSDNVIVQNAKIRNTKEGSVYFYNSEKSALLYSDISYSYDYMVIVNNPNSTLALEPMDVFVQNNVFSDTPSSISNVVYAGGCRTIVSHNHFIDCCMNGDGVEHIIEYNKFEGGNKFITDGGMVYFNNYNKRGIHVRYNLFHKINATHNAIYFDTMASGLYAYGNIISTLNAPGNSHKAWYSSTGHGNVCYANIIVLRNKSQIDAVGGKDTDEGTEAIKQGDTINESGLFYYYYGNNSADNSLAGHWWTQHKEREINYRLNLSDQEAWNARYPEYMNFIEGTKCILEAYENQDYIVYYKPQKLSDKTHVFKTADDTVLWVPPYEYLDENGEKKTKEAQTLKAENGQIVLTYDDLAAMERLRRQPAFSVMKNNLILGGSSKQENVITNGAANYLGLVKDVTLNDNNHFEFYYEKILADADNYDYSISDDVWAMLKSEMGTDFVNSLKDLDYKKAGLTR